MQGEADGVDAVAQVGGGVVALAFEHVPEMTVASRAAYLDARPTGEGAVLDIAHPVVGERGEKLGQPQWEENFSVLRNNSAPHPLQA